MITNHELDLAQQFVNHTDRNIFLTGKAGTGKTTFLHDIKKQSLKRMAVVAPTGVAAINAKGVTIHSFFQMPFGPIIPGAPENQGNFKRKFRRKKIDLIRSLDLLIIDEISMVRADLLDGIDQVLRKYKDRNKVFGGTQVLMIGDLQQLAPVVKDNEWQLLKQHYETPYFFSSKAFQQAQAINIELKYIYRQQDEKFIKVLNEIRDNKLSEESAKILNERYQPDFNPKDEEGYIILTTHNYKADKTNQEKLAQLKGKKYAFEAIVEGQFPENAFPNEEKLELKKGAQVMFIKNDSSFDKQYFNGKIGTITKINNKEITVKCPGDDYEIEVARETWDNVTYDIDENTNAIIEKVKGSYSQIPLRLAWAITIHKSQGLTFDKAIIDAELSFAHGQTYVALSRCKTLDGLVLKSPIKAQSIINDTRVASFNKSVAEHQPDEKVLQASKKAFTLNLIAELLDYFPFIYPLNRLTDIYYSNASSFQGNIIEPLKTIKDKAVIPLLKIKDNFIAQLKQMSADVVDIENDNTIQERIHKAINYFLEQTRTFIEKPFDDFNFSTDNKQLNKDFEKHVENIEELITQKLMQLDGLVEKYSVKKHLDLRADATLYKQPKKKKKTDVSKLLEHNDLFDALRDLRSEFSYNEDVSPYQVFTQETLYSMCKELPTTTKQLKKINGIGKVRLQKYGDSILEIIQAYCISNNIPMKEDDKTPEIIKAPKGQTKLISLEMFQAGKTPQQIADERELNVNTILTHLSSFVATGEIEANALIPDEKLAKLLEVVNKNDFETLSDLKQIVGNEFDWWELRLGIAVASTEK